jgi:hypothetical protein
LRRPSAPADSLAAELVQVDAARRALSDGHPRRALALLDVYDRTFAARQFGPEVVVLRIEALLANGQTGAAERLAQEFMARYSRHVLAARVRRLVPTDR